VDVPAVASAARNGDLGSRHWLAFRRCGSA